MPADPLNDYFISDTSRIQGKIEVDTRAKGRVSALMEKEVLPEGMGYNFSSVEVNRSKGTGGGWVAVTTPDGSGNNCVPTPTVVSPAMTQRTYSAYQTSIYSNDICFTDLRAAYNAPEQIKAIEENFRGNVVDAWEDRDKAMFFQNAGHKIVFNSSLSETTGGTTMPATVATSTINQALLDKLYLRITQDGGGEQPYAKRQGAPVIPAIMSMEANAMLTNGATDIQDNFRWAEAGKGADAATLLQSWGIDRTYRGFMHIIDLKMPRFDFVNGAWVERPFYSTSATTIGDEAVVNPAYETAEYEDLYLWHPKVVCRQVPTPRGSFGAGTSAKTISFNGEVVWLNIPDKELNPFQDIGFYAARLYAAYKPRVPRYGYVVRFKRCPNVATTSCPAY